MDIHNSFLNILNYLRISNIQLGISKNKLWISFNTLIFGYHEMHLWISTIRFLDILKSVEYWISKNGFPNIEFGYPKFSMIFLDIQKCI